jgi:PAS domain S-box-containing protein
MQFPFLAFYPATMVAAWYGGFAPGAVATGLSLAAVLGGQHAFDVHDAGTALALGVFVVINVLIAVFCESLHQAVRVHVAAAERLDALLWHAPVGLCFLDRDLRFVYVNDALTGINGLSREAHIGRSVGEVLPSGSAVATASLMRKVLRTGRPAVNRVVPDASRPHDGSDRVSLVSYCPVRGSDGEVELIAVAVMDITEQHRLSDALARSEARMQSIAQASIQMTSTVSIDQPLDDTLRIVADLVRELVGARQAAITLRDRAADRHGSTGGELEVPIIGRDREPLGVLRLDAGSKNGFAIEDRAVAVQFAQMASAVIESHQLFERIVEADRRKDEFLAMLGHELRNPLSAIQNAVTIAERDESHRLQAIEIAARQTEQLARLVNDLLDVARITKGRITLQQEHAPVAAVVRRAIEAARPQVEARQHRLVVRPFDESVTVFADPARIEQVIFNLLANAVKYTDPGGRIEVTTGREGPNAVVRVRDTGHGIARDMLGRVFELFEQAEPTLDRAQGGLGIGLTVARRLIELHGGQIEVHSEGLGRGSEFVVRLPVRASAPAPRAERHPPSPTPRRAAHVLVVEDNADAAESLAMLLEVLGHDAQVVHDAEAALDAVRDAEFDVMFIDIGLPGMSGFELAERLRARPEAVHAKLIALTGYGLSEDRARALAAGFDQHLVKPVEPGALERIVAHVSEADAGGLH